MEKYIFTGAFADANLMNLFQILLSVVPIQGMDKNKTK